VRCARQAASGAQPTKDSDIPAAPTTERGRTPFRPGNKKGRAVAAFSKRGGFPFSYVRASGLLAFFAVAA
jgi:hypothetical protein